MTAARAPRPAHRERFVSASELAEYAYCRRAWWLRAVRGAEGDGAVEGTRFTEGRAAHRRHGLGLLAARALAIAAALLLAVAIGLWLTHAR